MPKSTVTPIRDARSPTLAEVAPGTYAFTQTTECNDGIDSHQAISELLRARAILSAFTDSLDDSRAEDRYVLWTVLTILRDASELVEASDLFLRDVQP